MGSAGNKPSRSSVNVTITSNKNDQPVADSVLTLVDNQTSITQSNQGSNQVVAPPQLSTTDENKIVQSGPDVTSKNNKTTNAETVGSDTYGGGVNSNTNAFPNIYYNFKNYSYSSQNLNFKFSTDSLTNDTTSTDRWLCDTDIKVGNCNLIGDAGCLNSVSAYGKYFYELQYNKSISNDSFLQFPSFAPSYTVLVFAIANENTQSDVYKDFEKILNTAQVHKYIQTESSNSSDNVYNFGLESRVLNGKYTNIGKAQFIASSLNSTFYFKEYTSDNVVQPKNGPARGLNAGSNLFTDFKSVGRGSFASSQYTYYDLLPFNLYNLPNNLSNPSTATDVVISKNGSPTNYKNFCMFFVEMRAYVSPTSIYQSSNQVYFETYVNGVLTFQGWAITDKTLSTVTIKNYTVALSNKSVAADPGNKLFLFDYLQGASYNIDEMVGESRNVTLSLVSKYKNILVKNTSDLQISNSNTSLAFPLKTSHPFNKLFLASNSK